MINIILALWLAYNKYIRGKRDGRILSGQSKHIFLKIQTYKKENFLEKGRKKQLMIIWRLKRNIKCE